jgi:hypothetical protein
MTTDRLPNNQEDREVYLHDHRAGGFIKAVSDARHDSLDTVIDATSDAPSPATRSGRPRPA